MTTETPIEPKDIQKYFQRLSFPYYLTIGVPMVAFIMLYLESKSEGTLVNTMSAETTGLTELLWPLLILATIPLSYVVYLSAVKSARTLPNLAEKLKGFRTAAFMQYGLLLAGTVAAVVSLYLTSEALYAGIYCVVFFFQTVNRPSPEKIAKGLKLKKEEFNLLNQNRM